MRVFLYEHLSAGGAGANASLRTEGLAMLSALADDFRTIRGCEVWTLLAGSEAVPGVHQTWWCEAGGEEPLARRLAGDADMTLVIAPECAGILEERSRWVLEAGGRLGSCTPEAIRRTGDKRALAEHFEAWGIPSPRLLTEPSEFPLVLKPRDGAGSQATFLVRDREEWAASLTQAQREYPGPWLIQRFQPGTSASVAFLVGARSTLGLLPAVQLLSSDGRFQYEGGRVPVSEPLAQRAQTLASQAIATVSGLRGFVGVDLVLAEDPAQDVVIEINPRLTTSYIGLRALCRENLAQLWLALLQGEDVAPPSWRAGSVQFLPDGRIVS